jgi:formylmethanofuran dehydrogenase subunit A
VSDNETGVDTNPYQPAKVIAVTDGILIKGANQNLVNIYNVSGQTIASFTANENQFKALTQGIYIVKIGNEVFKTIVK